METGTPDSSSIVSTIPNRLVQADYDLRAAHAELYESTIATVVIVILITTFFANTNFEWKIRSLLTGLDLLVLTWAFLIAYNATILQDARTPLSFTVETMSTYATYVFVWQLLYTATLLLAKVSVLLHIKTLFTPHKSGLVYGAVQVLIWGNVAFYVSSFLAFLMSCIPITASWDFTILNPRCINRVALLLAMGVINVVSDLLILVLPIWVVWHLHIPVTKKLGVFAVFSTGVLAVVASIVRLVYTSFLDDLPENEFSAVQRVALWSLAEISAIILCVCFPTVPRCVELARSRWNCGQGRKRSKTDGSTYGNQNTSSEDDIKLTPNHGWRTGRREGRESNGQHFNGQSLGPYPSVDRESHSR